jgi:hypothetical protein
MRRAACFSLIAILAFVGGCTSDEAYLEVQREQCAAWMEMADILATVKDEPSMAAAKKALDERRDKFAAIARKAQALPRPGPEAQAKMREKQYLVESALDRLKSQAKRVNDLKPGGAEFMRYFQSSSQGLLTGASP